MKSTNTVAELNVQIHTLAQHRTRGFLDAAEYAARSGAVNQRINALRAERRRLLAEDENDEMLDALRGLNDILSLTDIQAVFNNELFEQIVTNITVSSAVELRFRLFGDLELAETLSYIQRR